MATAIDLNQLDRICNDVYAGRAEWPATWTTVRPRFNVMAMTEADFEPERELTGGDSYTGATRNTPMATEGQVRWITSLLEQLPEGHPLAGTDVTKVTKQAASKLINELKLAVPPKATDTQIDYIRRLVDERNTTALGVDWDLLLAGHVGPDAASKMIDMLKTCPFKSAPKAAADDEFTVLAEECLKLAGQHGARFAVPTEDGAHNELAFWVVVKRRERIYLNQYIGGSGPVRVRMTKPAQVAVLRKIHAAGVEASAILFGQEVGQCYRCALPLTDDDSRAAGIGPDCATKV